MLIQLSGRKNPVIAHFVQRGASPFRGFFSIIAAAPTGLPFWKRERATQSLAPFAREEKLARVEALLFLSDEPLSAKKISALCGFANALESRKALNELSSLLAGNDSSFFLEEVAGGFQLLTKNIYHSWLARLAIPVADMNLTVAMKETLAIVAYRQPIPRAEIEQIRGVNSSEVLHHLLEKNLIRILGRDNTLGRPVLYGSTKKFLQVFGLKSLKDLPQSSELNRVRPARPHSPPELKLPPEPE
ncbi:MAG: SMC-Scp complex subunit ScpB [Gemmataceae bacterium]|nr:SMC-Scp complex subunit ScpB [Gemmataceae bacterium]